MRTERVWVDGGDGKRIPPRRVVLILILATSVPSITHHETPAKASRQAHRWLHRRVAQAGEWATILDSATGAPLRRYVRRDDGRVERAQ